MTKMMVRVIDAYVYRKTIEGIEFLILKRAKTKIYEHLWHCLLYTSPSPRDKRQSRMPSSA